MATRNRQPGATRIALIAAVLTGTCWSPTGAQSPPARYIDKVATTPDFFQQNPRGNFHGHGLEYCGPTTGSDAIFYWASHGFSNLITTTDTDDADTAQIEVINALASERYMQTGNDGTSAVGLIGGLRRYVMDHGYSIKRLEYKGIHPLTSELRSFKTGDAPTIAWLESAVRDPNTCVWLWIGLYKHVASGEWTQLDSHIVLLVGYGTVGNGVADPNVLLIDNPNRQAYYAASTADTSLMDDSIIYSPVGQADLDYPVTGATLSALGRFFLFGSGLPHMRAVNADILDGAVVMTIGKPSN